MSQVIEFNAEAKIVRVTVVGELEDEGAEELYRSVHRVVAERAVRGGILDLSPVTSLTVSPETLRRLSKNPPLFPPEIVRVIVAPGDLIFGMARLFQISRSEIHSNLHVVHTLEEAYKVHGLQSPQFETM